MIHTTQDIGHIIRQARISQSLTQQQLAGFSGVGIRFLQELEKGKPTCQTDKTLKVLHALGLVVTIKNKAEL